MTKPDAGEEGEGAVTTVLLILGYLVLAVAFGVTIGKWLYKQEEK